MSLKELADSLGGKEESKKEKSFDTHAQIKTVVLFIKIILIEEQNGDFMEQMTIKVRILLVVVCLLMHYYLNLL